MKVQGTATLGIGDHQWSAQDWATILLLWATFYALGMTESGRHVLGTRGAGS